MAACGSPRLFGTARAQEHALTAFSTGAFRQQIDTPPRPENGKYLLIFRYLLQMRRISFYLGAHSDGTARMTDFPHDSPRLAPHLSLEDWLLAIATALVALLVLGVLPSLYR
jgi:hypothetical protein